MVAVKLERMPEGVALTPAFQGVLSADAVAFVVELVRRFTPQRNALLAARRALQLRLDRGERYDFLPETAEVRAGAWTVAPPPRELLDRRVEITGPVDRKMIINALNSGANVFMADFEDSTAPTWDNVLAGQQNLMDAVRRTISLTVEGGREYRLSANTAVLVVRPRGLHLPEQHLVVDGNPAPASLVDFGLYVFHNARELLKRGTAPYFYLPKLEHHLEARWWNDVFNAAQDTLGIPRGTFRATVLIETLPAAFQMDEILYELRQHSLGLNCGRWDYIFSFIKKLSRDSHAILPDRGLVTMTQPFLRSYSQLLIKTCHRRGAHAMGGMAAQIPIKHDPAANEAALERVRADKLREVTDGHDGTWVAHPALVPLAREIFDAYLSGPNQISRQREDVNVTARELLEPPVGERTEQGLRHNIRVGIQYLEAWLRGLGCVPLYNLMEDAATAEISRAQVWQWLAHGAALSDGTVLTPLRFRAVVDEEMRQIEAEIGAERMKSGRFPQARTLFEGLCTAPAFEDFLTLPAYAALTASG